ncbi:hypothetical protein OSB04_007351 [Centaurea solstitialis]|uniref:Uncharacterized protein n=1 Tax=Centaurea solstitialis TaxID=347529 RepID=A0AA38WT81_9ASTR|nr:hypothetical protein OSB04_007351 [Centaurea solstitialis]
MSTSLSFLVYAPVLPRRQRKQKRCSELQIRAQSLRDEALTIIAYRFLLCKPLVSCPLTLFKYFFITGRPSNLVDSNMEILKNRIEVMRTKERLERNCRPSGWDYTSSYIRKPKKQPEYPQIALICGTSSLSILVGTTLLCVFSVIAHLNP